MAIEEVSSLLNACTNIRDKFLLFLLYESGMRVGEALSLQLVDIIPGLRKIHIKNRGELENGAEIKTSSSERTIDCSQELINLYSSYILKYHTEEVDTNFIFIKLHGEAKNEPMSYTTVNGVFKNLKKKTGIDVTPHMFRHTSLTELWRTGEMRPETLKERAGHKHIQTTLNMYVQINEEDVRKDWLNAIEKKGKGEQL
jgi:integrase/recombinase XerD